MTESPWQPTEADAFVAMLMDCWQCGTLPWSAVEIVERDDGLLSANNGARYFEPPEAWGGLDRWAIEQARGRVLDICRC